MRKFSRLTALSNVAAYAVFAVVTVLALAACSPKYDWRDVRSEDSPYTVLMPGKPATVSREIQLGQEKVVMHMTTVQIDGVNFAVGAAKLPDVTSAQMSVAVIKANLVAKLGGKITHQKTTVANGDGKVTFNDEFGAISGRLDQNGSPTRMVGKIVARNNWVFQVLVVGPDKTINRDSVDTFLTSFKPL